MKMFSIVLLLSICSLVRQHSLYAKIEIKNDTPYELKAVVTYGSAGQQGNPYASINEGSVQLKRYLIRGRGLQNEIEETWLDKRSDDANNYEILDVQGFMPGEIGWTKKDGSYVKQKWFVWANIDNAWKLVINTSNHATGGLIKAVTATVTSKKDSKGETFNIKIKHGW